MLTSSPLPPEAKRKIYFTSVLEVGVCQHLLNLTIHRSNLVFLLWKAVTDNSYPFRFSLQHQPRWLHRKPRAVVSVHLVFLVNRDNIDFERSVTTLNFEAGGNVRAINRL